MRRLGQYRPTQQMLLRALLQAPQGATVETLCGVLRVTHNAVRQHLTALIAGGVVTRGQARASGGRPQMRYVLTSQGRELFPRNYDLIARKLIERLYAQHGPAQVQAMLVELGRELGEGVAGPLDDASEAGIATALAAQLDTLGYEAQATVRDGETQVVAFNCVFHALAREHPEVCRFDVAFLEAASGRDIQHLECLVRGGGCCRFRLRAPAETSLNASAGPGGVEGPG